MIDIIYISTLASWFLTCEEFFFHGCKPNLLIAGTKKAVDKKEEVYLM